MVWLSVLGCGAEGVSALSPLAQERIARAEVVFGSSRLLQDPLLEKKRCVAWSRPIGSSIEELLRYRGKPVCVLATGDPMHFGIGTLLLRQVPLAQMQIFPSPSAFSLAAARLGWSLQQVDCVSLCGRPASTIEPFLAPGVCLLVIGHGKQTVQDLVQRLCQRGLEQSRVVILESLGFKEERVRELRASDPVPEEIAPLVTVGITCIRSSRSIVLSRVPGLPDSVFDHDGQLTKSEVRAVTLSALVPFPGALLWDIGAGCGSVAIEWLRSGRDLRAVAIEKNAQRVEMITRNALALGVPHVDVREGEAVSVLAMLEESPDAIFMGGGVSQEPLFLSCWERLQPGSIFVANAVTLEGQLALMQRCRKYGGKLVRLEVSQMSSIGDHQVLRPGMGVLQWRVHRTEA